MWFRRDLRVHDLPALAGAARGRPDRAGVRVRRPAAEDGPLPQRQPHRLHARLPARAGRRATRPRREAGGPPRAARARRSRRWPRGRTPRDVYFTADSSPWSRRRDQEVIDRLAADGVRAHASPGAFAVDDPSNRAHRRGQALHGVHALPPRVGGRGPAPRPATTPRKLSMPSDLKTGRLPSPGRPRRGARARPRVRARRGGRAARPCRPSCASRCSATRSCTTTRPAARRGCRPTCAGAACRRWSWSAKAAEKRGAGAAAFVRQLAWRDFYAGGADALPPRDRRRSSRSATATWSGRAGRRSWTRGRRGAPATRSWTPACASCWPRAGCTTGCGWWWARS